MSTPAESTPVTFQIAGGPDVAAEWAALVCCLLLGEPASYPRGREAMWEDVESVMVGGVVQPANTIEEV